MVLYHATKGISDLITVPGLVNLDFADVRSIMTGMGDAIMGAGSAKGDKRAVEAASAAISSPLLDEIDIRGAKGVLVNITGGSDMTLHEVSEATSIIQDGVGSEANLIFGAVVSADAGEEMRVTVIATGFGEPARKHAVRPAADLSVVRPLTQVSTDRPATPASIAPRPEPELEPRIRRVTEMPRAMEAQSGGPIPMESRPREAAPPPAPSRQSMFIEDSPPLRPLPSAGEEPVGDRPSRGPSANDLDVPAFIRKTMD
jgi:cell division protein FtsZ